MSCLDELEDRLRAGDMAWVMTSLGELQDETKAGLRGNQLKAMRVLVQICPLVLAHEQLMGWARLLRNAVQTLGEDQLPLTNTVLGPVYVYEEQPHPYIETPKRRRRDRINPRQVFEMYLVLRLYVAANDLKLPITLADLDSLLTFARHIGTPYYTHKIYQTMAFILNDNGQAEAALNYTMMIGDFFQRRRETLDVALTRYAQGVALRQLGQPEEAHRCLNDALERMPTAYSDQRAYMQQMAQVVA